MRPITRVAACTGECRVCPAVGLDEQAIAAVNETVSMYDPGGFGGGPESDLFDETTAGLAAEAAEKNGVPEWRVPVINQAAQMVILNECELLE